MIGLRGDEFVYGSFRGFAKKLQCGVFDNVLAGREYQMDFRRIDNIDPDGPVVEAVLDFANGGQGAFDTQAVKVDAAAMLAVRIEIIDADTAAAGVFDQQRVLEEILSRLQHPVHRHRQGKVERDIRDNAVETEMPVIGHFDRNQRTPADRALFKGKRCAAVPCLGRNAHFPCRACRWREGLDFDGAAGKAEHAHAGGVFGPRDVMVPTGMSEQQQGGRIVDAATIVANMKGEATVLLGEIDGDARGAGAPPVLAHFVEAVAAIPREKARRAADRILADGRLDGGGKRHDHLRSRRRTVCPPPLRRPLPLHPGLRRPGGQDGCRRDDRPAKRG